MRYFRIVETNKFVIEESIVSEEGLTFLNAILKADGHVPAVAEELSQNDLDQIQDMSYYYIPVVEIGKVGSNMGEKNVFVDISGNKYHN